MLSLEKMSPRTITSANYITSVNGMLHPYPHDVRA